MSMKVAKDAGKQIMPIVIVVNFFLIVINAVIIYYMFEVTKSGCDCTKDWRQLYIKICSSALIIISMIKIYSHSNNIFSMLLNIIIVLATGINVYSLFTYVGDLNEQNCKCAVENQNSINDFLKVWRWIMACTYIIIFLGLLITIVHNNI